MRPFATALFVFCIATGLFASNPIQIENARQGTTEWKTGGFEANGEVEGFASPTSVNRGESVSIYVNTPYPSYTLQVFRMGWYGGTGARRVYGPVTLPGTAQPIPVPDPVTGLVECNWTNPHVLGIPATDDWISGVYLVKLTANGRHKYTIFVVRDDARFSNHYFQLSVTTYQAYNNWGGKSLYTFNSTDQVAARKVSLDRPYITGSGTGDFLYRWEYNMLRFMEREGYDVTYHTNVDTHERPALMLNHQDWLSIGHDEYWSWEMFDHVQAARDAGIDLGFFSANTAYWQIRYEPNATGVPNRTIVSYKEKSNSEDPYALDGDPANDHLITKQFRQVPVNRPESQLLGVEYIYNPVTNGDIIIDDVTTQPWVFEGTGLVTGSRLPKLLGYEVDHMTEHSPDNIVRLGNSPYVDKDTGKTEYSHMTIYDAPGGAHVFATGTIQWAWGLDSWNEGADKVNPAAQQMTRNILRRFAGPTAERDCFALISPTATTVAASAGSADIAVQYQSYCGFSAQSNTPWITLTSITNNNVTYAYTANDGPARSGTITIGESTFVLSQQSGCTYSIAPTYSQYPASGGGGSFTLTSGSGCPWTAVPNVPWITLTTASSGTGAATIGYSVAPNVGPARSGRIQVGNNYLTIDQSNGCTYTASPLSLTVGASGGTRTVQVTPSSELCFWSVSTSATWITFSPAAGQGSGSVSVTIAPSSGTARSGSVTVARNRVSVTQTNDCSTTVANTPQVFTRTGGAGSIGVTSCSGWTATSNASWITLTNSSGSGNGNVGFNVAANGTNRSRTGTITIAGQPVTITQYGTHIRGDFDGDGWQDLLWRHAVDGRMRIWRMQGTTLLASIDLPSEPGLAWYIVGVGDFTKDGLQDIMWRNNATGENRVWSLLGTSYGATLPMKTVADLQWKAYTVFDYENDGGADVGWRHGTTGSNILWRMDGTTLASTTTLSTVVSQTWTARGSGLFNPDLWNELVWHNVNDGRVVLWFMAGTQMTSTTQLGVVTDPNMELAAIFDVDRSGLGDILWRNNATGENMVWLAPGGVYKGTVNLPTEPDGGWRIVGPK